MPKKFDYISNTKRILHSNNFKIRNVEQGIFIPSTHFYLQKQSLTKIFDKNKQKIKKIPLAKFRKGPLGGCGPRGSESHVSSNKKYIYIYSTLLYHLNISVIIVTTQLIVQHT